MLQQNVEKAQSPNQEVFEWREKVEDKNTEKHVAMGFTWMCRV